MSAGLGPGAATIGHVLIARSWGDLHDRVPLIPSENNEAGLDEFSELLRGDEL